jgi:hypothetical protein
MCHLLKVNRRNSAFCGVDTVFLYRELGSELTYGPFFTSILWVLGVNLNFSYSYGMITVKNGELLQTITFDRRINRP